MTLTELNTLLERRQKELISETLAFIDAGETDRILLSTKMNMLAKRNNELLRQIQHKEFVLRVTPDSAVVMSMD